ncbi:hypothetical protein [Nostoc sp.]|uniref:hypothetical protein n=1 Tax=Nostoc sp. TaxID=1180 RepID=UPI002FFC7DC6
MQNNTFLEFVKRLGTKVTPIDECREIPEEEMARIRQQVYEATGVKPNYVLTKRTDPD